jgi:hypothetical protein
MNEIGAYTQHKGVAVGHGKFSHVMALTLNPKTNYTDGLIRCISERKGDVAIKGFLDISVLYKVKSKKGLKSFEITKPLKIAGQEEIIKKLSIDELEFIGLEDPDLVLDPKTGLIHLYFTIPFVSKGEGKNRIYLGHAQGKSLNSLKITMPVLPSPLHKKVSAKELAVAPENKNGVRLNLFESRDSKAKTYVSIVRVAVAQDFGSSWRIGKTVIHPLKTGYSWCLGHVSPGPFLPKEFIDPGRGKVLGLLNGREKDHKKGKITEYGIFSVGLFIYDYEKGKADWISEKPFIVDSQARNITFASHFIQTEKNKGILYAHIDDSFVRAYTIYAEELKRLINK